MRSQANDEMIDELCDSLARRKRIIRFLTAMICIVLVMNTILIALRLLGR